MKYMKSATVKNTRNVIVIIKKRYVLKTYLKSKHSFALLTMHHNAREARKEFVTKAQIISLPPKSETCISYSTHKILRSYFFYHVLFTYMILKYIIQTIIISSHKICHPHKYAQCKINTKLYWYYLWGQ